MENLVLETQKISPALAQLLSTPLPQKTDSYQPVSHANTIEYFKERFDKMGLTVETENYTTNKKGEQMFAQWGIGANDSEFRIGFGFRNSYDKSMPVGAVSGAQVIVCSNMMFTGEIINHRRHTKNILSELDNAFDPVFDNIEKQYQAMLADASLMKQADLQIEDAQRLFGKMLMGADDYKTRTAAIQEITEAARLFRNPINGFGNDSYWGFYNSFTEVFKSSHPYVNADQHLRLHNFVKNEIQMN